MAKEPKMVTCKHCGAEIAASAKTCPQCGGKNKKPFYKNPLLIGLVVVVIIIIAATAGGDSSDGNESGNTNKEGTNITNDVTESAAPEVTYTAYAVSELVDDLNANALKAADKYDEQYVELTGKLGTIDSSGDYICIEPSDDEYSFTNVQCYLRSDDQKDVVLELQQGDSIVVKGKITSVGEVLGYSLTIDEISKAG
jgi:RNA polymerase subunit RPABC4/transcription elongation factor Spt4